MDGPSFRIEIAQTFFTLIEICRNAGLNACDYIETIIRLLMDVLILRRMDTVSPLRKIFHEYQNNMAQFIELHCKHNGNPLYINVDSIAFIENENGRVYVNFLMQRVSTSGNNVSSYVYREEVSETYLQVKALIEE